MSFIEKLPTYYRLAKLEVEKLEGEIRHLWGQLEENEEQQEKSDHFCDCEYCPYQDLAPVQIMSLKQCQEIEEQIDELELKKCDYVKSVARMEGYARLVKVRL